MYKIYVFLFAVLSGVLCFSTWGVWQYGDIEIESLIFHLHMPLKNSPTDWLTWIWIPAVLTISLSCWPVILKNRIISYPKRAVFVLTLFFMFDLYYADRCFKLFNYIEWNIQASDFIEKNYVDAKEVEMHFPNKKKNLILIQVESLETTVQDKKNGGIFDVNAIPYLTHLAQRNTSFSHAQSGQGATVLPGTGWTIAGLVAETAGIPLKLYKTHKQIGNNIDRYSFFLPGVVSLGDILEKNGYKNIFILGTGKEFAGQENYLKQHGKYFIFDKADISKNGDNVSDKRVLEFAKSEIEKWGQTNQPFHLLIQTFDTHFGYVKDEKCPTPFEKKFQNAFFCIDSHLKEFMNWFAQTDIYNDTVIVIVGDHLTMGTTIMNEMTAFDKKASEITRKVYNVFIHSAVEPVQKKYRRFSTMDMFPTILASMGVKIKGNRLGLGTNLFSTEKTLSERYGYTHLFWELRKKSDFYNHKLLYAK